MRRASSTMLGVPGELPDSRARDHRCAEHRRVSPAPNPYTSTATVSTHWRLTTFLNPQSFQIISSGIDGQYGVGGQYTPDATGEALPLDTSVPDPYNTSDTTIRVRERDNVTNFHNGKLE